MENLPKRTIMVVCCCIMMLLSFATSAPPIFLTDIADDIGIPKDQRGEQGLVVSSPMWGFTLAMLVSGFAADCLGFRAPLLASTVLQSAGLMMMSLATGRASMLVGGVVTGVGTGMADALLTPIVCAIFPAKRERMSNVLHAFYPVGLTATIAGVVALILAGWPWRWVFRAMAVLALLPGFVLLFLKLPAQSHEGEDRSPTWSIVRRWTFVLFFAAMLLGGATEMGPTSWLPTLVKEAVKDTVARGSVTDRVWGASALLPFAVAMALGRFSSAALVHKLGARRLLVGGGVICALGLGLAAFAQGPVAMVAWLTVVGFGVASFWPTILACVGNRFPQGGAFMFAVLASAGCLGCALGPAVMGFIADQFGLSRSVATLAGAPVVAAIIMGSLLRTKPRSPGPDPNAE